jgi:predicted nucleic acid-binding protein
VKRAILLDTNMLIGAFDTDIDNPKHVRDKERLAELLRDNDVKLSITPLIRYEFLRGAKRVPLDALEAILDDFQEFEVGARDARLAAEVFRHDRQPGAESTIDKKRFDVFHCVCAKLNDLDMISSDQDVEKIQNIIKELDENAQAH